MKLKDGDLMTAGDAAKVLGLSTAMVAKMARLARLPAAARTVGGFRLFWSKDVRALEAQRAKARASAASLAR